MTLSCQSLKHSLNESVQLQLIITSIRQTVWSTILSGSVWPDLGPNCLKRLSADDNVMFKFNAKLKYIGSTSTCHNL